MNKRGAVDLNKSREEALRHWVKCFRDGTVDDQHYEFIAEILEVEADKLAEVNE